MQLAANVQKVTNSLPSRVSRRPLACRYFILLTLGVLAPLAEPALQQTNGQLIRSKTGATQR